MRYKDTALADSIYNFIRNYQQENRSSPGLADIAEAMNIAISTTSRYIKFLEEQGRLKYLSHKGIKLLTPVGYDDLITIPRLGLLLPIPIRFHQLNKERLNIFQNSDKECYFIVVAPDNAMEDAGILIGDNVLLQYSAHAANGNIVCAILDGVPYMRRLYFQPVTNDVCFIAENIDYGDITPKDYEILGVAKNVVKKIKT